MTSSFAVHFRAPDDAIATHGMSLQILYCRRCEFMALGHSPCPVGRTETCRKRIWKPWSQALEQGPHCVQALSSQSLSHDWGLQVSVCVVSPQALPPNSAGLWIILARVITPPLQGTLQELQPLQELTRQSTGHSCSLQLLVIERGGQAAPISAGATIVRESC